MSSDFRIEPVGGGSYDLVLTTTDGVDDFDLIGDTSETHQAAVAQRITYKVGTWLGESPFDRSVGFPWEQTVFGRQPIESIVVFLYDQISSVEGVDSITEPPAIDFDNATRKATISVQVQGRDFEVTLQQILQEPS